MSRCEECGTDVTLPFRCNFCSRQFCDEHRLPENHACLSAPSRTPLGHWKAKKSPRDWKTSSQKQPIKHSHFSSEGDYHFVRQSEDEHRWERKPKKKVRLKNVATSIVAVSSIVVILFVLLQNPIFLPNITEPDHSPNIPTDVLSDAGSKTYSHEELVNYALLLINNDRQSHGLQNVTLSYPYAAQQHAEHMLEHNFLSHWDTSGLKPHMRYTQTGGLGAVSENNAWTYSLVLKDAKKAIASLHRSLVMSFDHWRTIVNPFHNKVDIGIAYDGYSFYLVQDFENDYVEWETFAIHNNEVTMKGTLIKQGLSIDDVAIYYDNPAPLTVEQLTNTPYNYSYDMGTFVGMALPSGWKAVGGITIEAKVWTLEQNFEVQFNLSEAFTTRGEGVYTLCLRTEDNDFLTTYSVWYEG